MTNFSLLISLHILSKLLEKYDTLNSYVFCFIGFTLKGIFELKQFNDYLIRTHYFIKVPLIIYHYGLNKDCPIELILLIL